MYTIFILSHLDYCDIIFMSPLTNLFRCFGYIKYNYGDDRGNTIASSFNNYRNLARNQSQQTLRRTWMGKPFRCSRRLFRYYKICNNMTPTYLLDNVPLERRLLCGNTDSNTDYEISAPFLI